MSPRRRAVERALLAYPTLVAAFVVVLAVGGVFLARLVDRNTDARPIAAPSRGPVAPYTIPATSDRPTGFPTPAPTSSAAPSRSSSAAPRIYGVGDPVASSDTGPPTRVVIPSLGVDSGLQPLGLLRDGTLQAPSQWAVAGWYARGVVPGQVGPAVIAGHVDSRRGPAVFYRLRDLAPGASVYVTMSDRTRLHFVVDGTRSFPKSGFPSAAVYGLTPDPELRLITCTGDFDAGAHSYVDNLVVSAHLVSPA